MTELTAGASISYVQCLRCGQWLPTGDADIVGMGYRCTRCSVQANIDELTGCPDVVDQLPLAERVDLADRGRRSMTIGLLAYVAIIPIVIALAGEWALALLLTRPGFALLLGPGVAAWIGFEQWRRFKPRGDRFGKWSDWSDWSD